MLASDAEVVENAEMDSWFRVTLTPSDECVRLASEMVAFSLRDEVREQMTSDVGVYCRSLLTEEYFQVYFTPAAAKVFAAFVKARAGVACLPPPVQSGKGDLSLLVGSADALHATRSLALSALDQQLNE